MHIPHPKYSTQRIQLYAHINLHSGQLRHDCSLAQQSDYIHDIMLYPLLRKPNSFTIHIQSTQMLTELNSSMLGSSQCYTLKIHKLASLYTKITINYNPKILNKLTDMH